MSRDSFAKRLDDAMYMGRVSSTELAKRMQVSRTTVNNWRAGHGQPADLERVTEIAAKLGVPAGWLATGVDDSVHPPTSQGRVAVPGHGTLLVPQSRAKERSQYEALQDRIYTASEVLTSLREAVAQAQQLVRDLQADLEIVKDQLPKQEQTLSEEVDAPLTNQETTQLDSERDQAVKAGTKVVGVEKKSTPKASKHPRRKQG